MDFDYYTSVLYKQFCETRGYEYDLKSVIKGEIDLAIYDEFVSWIENSLVDEYADYLNKLKYHNMSHAIEVNKGKYDTITGTIPMPTVSPFNYTLGKPYSKLNLTDGIVFVGLDNQLLLPGRIFVTHNPYDNSILKWPKIQKRKEHDISIGFYGLTTDANYQFRKEQVRTLLRYLNDCQVDFDTDKDKYFISINSRNKLLKHN